MCIYTSIYIYNMQHLKSIRALTNELKEFISENELAPKRLPHAQELQQLGRSDLHQAILRHGGYCLVAERLQWQTHRKPRGHWSDIDDVAEAIKEFVVQHSSCIQNKKKVFRGDGSDFPQSQAEIINTNKISDTGSANGENCEDESGLLPMPTHEQLRKAGRHDLRHALQLHGSAAVARRAGLRINRQGGNSRRKKTGGSQCEDQREIRAFQTTS